MASSRLSLFQSLGSLSNKLIGTIRRASPIGLFVNVCDDSTRLIAASQSKSANTSTNIISAMAHLDTKATTTVQSMTATMNNPLFNSNGVVTVSSPIQPQHKYSSVTLRTEELADYPANGLGGGFDESELGGLNGTSTIQHLSYKPYPIPKTGAFLASSPGGIVCSNKTIATKKPGQSIHHCHHHQHYHHRCYGSSVSLDGLNNPKGLSPELTDTCSIGAFTTASKEESEGFTLKFPKLRYLKVTILASLIIYTLVSNIHNMMFHII